MASKIVLPNTSLCSIVRDEKMNPAGGIQRFVEAHVPFVEEAVIVDTGSLDGTREILEEMQSKYPNLRVYDHKFDGFGNSRNYSLNKVKTKYALVLDADELLCQKRPTNDWEELYKTFNDNPYIEIFNFDFNNILPNGKTADVPCWGSRLIKKSILKDFSSTLYECINIRNKALRVGYAFPLPINHFLPDSIALETKKLKWYQKNDRLAFRNNILDSEIAPSQTSNFQDWKKYNPQRENYF